MRLGTDLGAGELSAPGNFVEARINVDIQLTGIYPRAGWEGRNGIWRVVFSYIWIGVREQPVKTQADRPNIGRTAIAKIAKERFRGFE